MTAANFLFGTELGKFSQAIQLRGKFTESIEISRASCRCFHCSVIWGWVRIICSSTSASSPLDEKELPQDTSKAIFSDQCDNPFPNDRSR